MTTLIDEIQQFLKTQSDPAKRPPEGYTGSNHLHYGVSVPALRKFVREWTGSHKQITYEEFITMLDHLYQGESLEERIIAALILARLTKFRRQVTFEKLESWLDHLEGWVEIDSTCQSTFTAAEVLPRWVEWEAFLRHLSKDANTNKRRASLVLLNLTMREASDPRVLALALELIDALKGEKDKRITKAISWLLREGIKYHQDEIARYLTKNRESLPKLAVREVQQKLDTGKKG